jgi:GTPase SAR1 family protein
VWDVGANSMGRSFLRGSNAIFLVVDLSNHASMENIDDIYEKVRNFSGFPDDNFPCLLIGNKLDLAQGEKREITMDMMKNWVHTYMQTYIHIFKLF